MKAIRRFWEFGGWRLVRAYWRMGIVGTLLLEGMAVVLRRRDWDTAYAQLMQQVVPHLRRQYYPLLLQLKQRYKNQPLEHHNSGRIWFCWLQGMEVAPPLVHACLQSIQKNIPEREVVVVTADNYGQYISLPAEIVERYYSGHIPHALFADMLRLALLCEHGGTWMDASILCTGHNFPERVLDCDLFLFQSLRPGAYRFRGISNWFITAHSHNPLLLILRDMLYQYWHDHDCTLDYYIFHLFFAWLAQEFPDEVAAMPRGNREPPLCLGANLGNAFDSAWWERLTALCAFHKLNFRKGAQTMNKEGSYCAHILALFGNAT